MASLIKSIGHAFDDSNGFKKIRGKKKLKCVRIFRTTAICNAPRVYAQKFRRIGSTAIFKEYPYTCLVESTKCPSRYVEDTSK